jgi:hypothetical protein
MAVPETIEQPTGYPQSADTLDELLLRKPEIARNKMHSDEAYAIANCPGATGRVMPASLVFQDLDDFICSSFPQHGILAREVSGKYKLPICVGDVVTFQIVSQRKRGPILHIQVETTKNGGELAQAFELTLIILTGEQ